MLARWFLSFCLLINFPSAVIGADYPAQFLQGLSGTEYHHMEAAELNRAFHIYVSLPNGYEDSDQDYPTIYLLDGGHSFPQLVPFHRFQVFAEELPAAILVGISYGADSLEEGNRRGTDFTAPAVSREHYGGAPVFLNFLKSGLFPKIEQTYRSSPDQRILFGQSLGGQFALYAALHAPQAFAGLIASNPALHRNLDYFLVPPSSREASGLSLYVSSGTNEEPQFRGPALAWMDYWKGQGDIPWKLKMESLEGHNHFSPLSEAYRRGLRWILR